MLILSSCYLKKKEEKKIPTLPNHWFSVNKNHSLQDLKEEPKPHLLFDVNGSLQADTKLVDVMIETPEHSPNAFIIDLLSGQRYFSHNFCRQDDIWKGPHGVYRPSFSVAVMPKVLDQLGLNQKVIVFSKRRDFAQEAINYPKKVRLVGSYIEQICPNGNCLGKDNWLSRLVFLAVDSGDQTYADVVDIPGLQTKINWEKVKAELQNLAGQNHMGDKYYPYIKVASLVEINEAMAYFKKRSIALDNQYLAKIQKGCFILYDRLWEEVGKFRPEDEPANTEKELMEKMKVISALKEKRKPYTFAQRLANFTEKFSSEITTCDRFVYHGNINQDIEKFWFLSYMGIFYRMHKDGHHFDCPTKRWTKNILDINGKRIYDLKADIQLCSNSDIDLAMSYLPNYLKGLKGEPHYYRFIDYDNRGFGTHEKIYSWVGVQNLKMNCSKDINEEIKKHSKVFPDDVRWKERNANDISHKLKIIQ